MATVFTDTVLPETSGVNEDLNLGAVGDSVTLPTVCSNTGTRNSSNFLYTHDAG